MEELNISNHKQTIRKVLVGKNVKFYDFINIYECTINDNTQVGAFVEIQRGVTIGKICRIQSHTFICEGVIIEDEVFIGHGVMFINDNKPSMEKTIDKTWELKNTLIKKGAVIGTGAVILGGVIVGSNAIVGAGAVVTRNVEENAVVVGNPARRLEK